MKFLDIDLSPEDQKELSEMLTEWKETELAKMKQALSESKTTELERIEESLIEYKKDVEEEYIDKVNTIIESIKPQLRKQVLVEMNETNPDMLVIEKIKELVYPLINESGKSYVNEISLLKKEIDELKEKDELTEGLKKKEHLLMNYSEKTKKILNKMIGEGNEVEITEKFYEIIETFQEFQEDEISEESSGNDILDDIENNTVVSDVNEDAETSTEEDDVEVFDEDFVPTVETSTEQELKENTERSKKPTNPIRDSILSFSEV